ncbi:MAG: methyltransferase domain-containing protein [Burkholderiales bacterium]
MLDEHLGYVSDRIRLDRFRAAIAEVLRPGDRVADLGCGTGVLGLLCLQAGASHVYAIDASAILEVARQTLTRAGFGDRTTFVRGLSQRIDLPTRVDLVICDHVGFFGFDYGILDVLRDARQRFLANGGRLVPSSIRLHVDAVESLAFHGLAEAWRGDGVPREYRWLRQATVNTKHAVRIPRDAVLSAPAVLGELDLAATSPDFLSWTADLRIIRDGFVHGLGGWFDCALSPGVRMDNSPVSGHAIDRDQAFLPLDEPIAVRTGDCVTVRVMARPADNLLAWVVAFPSSGRRFSHSTWNGLLLAPGEPARSRPERVPRLTREAQAREIALRYCDGTRSAGDIERAVLRDHPHLFPSTEEVARFVAQVLARDTDA